MFTKIKDWFHYTSKDFKDFSLRQSGVLISFFALWILSFVIGHFLVLHSEPYAISEKFLKESARLSEELGGVSFINLQPLSSAVKFSGSSGFADLELHAAGEKAYCTVKTYLKKENGTWVLNKAHAIMPNYDVVILKQ